MKKVESRADTVIASDKVLPKSKWTKADMLEAMTVAAAAANMVVEPGVFEMRKDEIFERWFSAWPLELPIGQSSGARYRLDANPAALAEWARPTDAAPPLMTAGENNPNTTL